MASHPNRSKSIRPRNHLVAAGKLYPQAWKQLDMFRAGKGRALPNWPDWCFVPMAASYAVVSADAGVDRIMDIDLIGDVARLTALATYGCRR